LVYIAEPLDGYNRAKMWIVASISAKFVFAGGAALVSFFLIRHSRRYFGRGEPSRLAPPTRTVNSLDIRANCDERLHAAPNANPLSDNLASIIPVHDAVRDLMGELDTKMAAFQALLRLGNEVAARLELAVERAEEIETKSSS
jgi:hypothetical protein